VALYLIDSAAVSVNTVVIKFGRTVKISTLTNNNFRVYTDAATPVEVTSAFANINTLTDYNQISRTLTLYWNKILQPTTDYIIKVANLLDSSGVVVPEESISFTSSGQAATPETMQEVKGIVVEEVLIEDKSVRADIEAGYQIIAKNPNFYISSVDPANGDFYLDNSYNNGRVVITFSARPASNFLANKYFKAQRKKIQKTPSRWESVNADISIHSWKPDVYVDFPSDDATPVYNTSNKTYFEEGYKYRIIVSSEIGI